MRRGKKIREIGGKGRRVGGKGGGEKGMKRKKGEEWNVEEKGKYI